ncbi:hydroxyacid dehydrogenase [Sulfolobus sp. E5-1-F]|uniref:hydroxyacid dehydrogenase n=1 Tax=Saccharolobus sp. E5-1-F TaxID=2663019 RepID=UPI0012956689|nr:hydroxyacid dehydrogenase [Sulfolobus sp. E5-1-F]QGA54009.1 hydroxyacid dehydrogenase [Sulfolobus sp. E5-1-F]
MSSHKLKVLVERSIFESNSEKVKKYLEELKELADVEAIDPYASRDEWLSKIKDVIAIINRKAKLDKEILQHANYLRLIARTGVGVDETRIDLDEAKRRGIIITYNPGVNSPSVVELTFLLALALMRKLTRIYDLVKGGKWVEAQGILGWELYGKTMGIIGLGNIGKRVARVAKAFEMRVIGYDPYVIEKPAEVDEMAELRSLLSISDVVTLHIPLTKETKGLIGRKELLLMKKNAIIINTSRGGIIDEEALYEALVNKTIAGAGLDVLSVEPPLETNPLLKLENVIITPHIGGVTAEAFERGAENAILEVMRFLKGEPLKNVFKY